MGLEAVVAAGGFVIGVLGTLVGAGGGFLIVPLLFVLEPRWTTEQITAVSLAVVTANAATGALSYWRQKRVDAPSFRMYTAAALPGSVAGVYLSRLIPRLWFDPVFGATLIVIGLWLLVQPDTSSSGRFRGSEKRLLIDRGGQRYEWSFDPRAGFAGSFVVGFVSSTLGIGGGIIQVPFLANVLGYPAHVATATSHAVLAITAGFATALHLLHGDYVRTWPLTLAAASGAIAGAPFGAKLSAYVKGAVILRVLAVALVFVGARLLLTRHV